MIAPKRPAEDARQWLIDNDLWDDNVGMSPEQYDRMPTSTRYRGPAMMRRRVLVAAVAVLADRVAALEQRVGQLEPARAEAAVRHPRRRRTDDLAAQRKTTASINADGRPLAGWAGGSAERLRTIGLAHEWPRPTGAVLALANCGPRTDNGITYKFHSSRPPLVISTVPSCRSSTARRTSPARTPISRIAGAQPHTQLCSDPMVIVPAS